MVLSQREKWLIAGIAILAIVLSFWRFVHEPLFTRRASAQESSDKVQTELTRDKAKLAKEGDLKLREKAVAAREETIDSWVPGKNSAALFIWYLSQAEQTSGAQIKGITLGDRQEVAVKTQQDAAGAPATGSNGQNSAGTGQSASVPNLTVVQLDLKVNARFAEHLLFNQALEEMPLFLNTESFAMARADKAPLDMVGSLIAKGDIGKAAALLQASPVLGGSYQIKLYFKSGKVGPSTDAMHFADPTGRMDPFAMDGVNEFLRAVIDYYNNRPTDCPSCPGDFTLPPIPSIPPSELG